jgi:hypothetical protein
MTIALTDLAQVLGGQLAGCPVVNLAGGVTFAQNGQSQKLDSGSSTIASPGSFSVTGQGGTVTEDCKPGQGYGVVGNPASPGSFGVMPFSLPSR